MKNFARKSADQLFATRRIENLTDGVFAIAMTLLVLDLKIPYGTAIASPSDLLTYFSQNAALFRNFLISFALLATMWAIHMRQFEQINRVDRHATMVNSVRLLLVVLIPFTASVAGNYPEILLARELMALNFFLLALATTWQWYYVCKHPEFSDDLTDSARMYGMRRNIAFTTVAGLVCVAVLLVHEYAYFLYFLIPVLMYFSTRNLKVVRKVEPAK